MQTRHATEINSDCLLTTDEAVDAWLDLVDGDRSGGGFAAMDTEADSLHSYREKICLIQINANGHEILIDPFTVNSWDRLLGFLSRCELWLHGSDYDLTLLNRHFSWLPPKVHDTQIAARLIGERQFGLAALIDKEFGVTLSKRGQRANWALRPIAKPLIEYALNDVRYMPELASRLMAKLTELGRVSWFEESCSALKNHVIERPAKNDENAWRISGWGRLSRKGLAYLREIWRWREEESERRDKPVFRLLNNDQLLNLSQRYATGQDPSLPKSVYGPGYKAFLKAVATAAAMEEQDCPKLRLGHFQSKPKDLEKLVKPWLEKRERLSEELGIEGSVLASRASLERYVIEPETYGGLMNWQREVLGI